MEKLTFKEIESLEDINMVLNKFEFSSGVRLPLEYAKNSRIVGVFLHNKLVASYMLVTGPDFRSLLFVPDETKASNPFFEHDSYEFMEVNGFWMSPALKSPIQQVTVWLHLIKDIFFSRKKYVLLMRNLHSRNMERFMGMANPKPLFQGAPYVVDGNYTHNQIQVSYTTRWKIVLNSHKYLVEYRNRLKRAAAFSDHRGLIKGLEQSEASLT